MRVVPDIIGFLCHECVENKETEHKIKTNAFLRPKCSTVASIVIFMEVTDHTLSHFLWVDGRNKTTWHFGIALEKLPIHSPGKRHVILCFSLLCAVHGINNKLNLSRLAMFFWFCQ